MAKDRPKALSYEIDVVPNEHGGYYARIPDFPTIFTGGETPEEAVANAQDAIVLMIEECRDRGQPVPEPLSAFSGRFNVRVPRAVHRELVRRAEIEGVSLNAVVNLLIARSTGMTSAAGSVLRRKPQR
jgi:antitoxin HicB